VVHESTTSIQRVRIGILPGEWDRVQMKS